jgi:rubredoxin-NAD+ reductase
MSAKPLIVVGSGTSGYTLVRQLRALDKERLVLVLTADGGEVYSKPMLSNALAKSQSPERLVQKSAELKAAELQCQVLPRCEVRRIDATAHRLDTSAGEFDYSQLVLATGAHQRVFLPEGTDRSWIYTVNSLDDFRHWYPQLMPGRRVLLIGAGLIGCEFADDLITHGLQVELVDPASWPLARLLPQPLGEALRDALSERGARLHMGRKVARLQRSGDDRFRATLDTGAEIEIDRVLSATGLVPETTLARSAGLECGLGVRVDRQLRTSNPDIFALGDCAETPAGFLPFIQPIMVQAKCLAEVLAGKASTLLMKAMPVLVKTTSLPVVVCPPPTNAVGEWSVSGAGRDWVALFKTAGDCLLGFALTGEALKQQQQLLPNIPPLLA